MRQIGLLCCLVGLVLLPAQIASAETQGEQIVAFAASQAGVPYCEPGGSIHGPTACGGMSATFDCTGLTMYAVYQATGIVLPHSGAQGTTGGQRIYHQSELQPGDLVFFGGSYGSFEHAGVYAGNGEFWDANNWGVPVQKHSLAWEEHGLPFVGGDRYWSGGAGGGGIGEGSFVQVAGHGEVFKIVGGAPLYVSSWNAVGGPQPVTAISQQQFDSLRPYPVDGTIVNTTNDGRVYEFVGGAPLYVSSWDAIGGPRSSIPIDGWDVANPGNPAAHVREYPADGSLIATTDDGMVYEIVGGAPLYVSNWEAIGGSRPAVGVDGWDVANAGNPYSHLRPYPADGTLVNTTNDGRVYEFAGGAPLYVSSWEAIGGSRPSVPIDGWDVANPGNPAAHVREYPADGTLIVTTDDGRVYEIAGGAPLYVSSWEAIGGSRPALGVDGWDVDNAGNPYSHLRPYPADGTFLNTSTGRVYRVAGGSPFAVSSWDVFGGVQPYTTIDQWDVDNDSNPYAHLRSAPLDGTVVEGLPSGTYWSFEGGLRTQVPAASGATGVDDFGLGAFAMPPEPAPAADAPGAAAPSKSASQSPSSPAGDPGSGSAKGATAATRGHVTRKVKACRKIKSRPKRAKCIAVAKRAADRGTAGTTH